MKITLYHGSKDIIKKPVFGYGKPINDYGLGFYCTKDLELAKEWSSSDDIKCGYANIYELETDGLKILNLNDEKYSIFNWLAILLKFRDFNIRNYVVNERSEKLIEKFYIDIEDYDVVIGYRADDSYFLFAKNFLDGNLDFNQLNEAMRLGKLGEQVVIKSKKAFDLLVCKGFEVAECPFYYLRKLARDYAARNSYQDILKEKKIQDELTIIDLLKKDFTL